MTRTATLSPASLAALMKAANAVNEASNLFRNVVLNDTAQGDLFEAGADQACEDFVAEREDLKAQLAEANETIANLTRDLDLVKDMLRQELDSQSVYTDGLRSQIDRQHEELTQVSNAYHRRGEDIQTANAVLKHVADYANELQGRLNTIGIYHQADPETGEPRISVNIAQLDAAVRDMIDRS